ncbi:MAG TPA: VanZ family protein [Blastocatellia bacterium]|nr:VanZ family protein [Blastocatellia bacterium]
MVESVTTAGDSLAMKVVKYWLPVLLMIVAMYYFSTDVLSGENTRSFIEEILGWLGYNITPRTAERLNYITRKAAHFIEYAILAALLFRAFRADSIMRWRLRWAVYSFFVAAAWALLDEYHQTFTHDRTGSIKDSMLDSAGALFMLIVIAVFNYRKNRKQAAL